MKKGTKLLRELTLLSQLGISLVTPPLVLTWLCAWLSQKFQIGPWLTVLGLVVGLLAALSTAISFFRRFTRKSPKEPTHPTSFNSHD